MRESDIEDDLCALVEAEGGHAYKFASPGCRGVPDRLVLKPIPPEHRALVAKYIRFVELKAPGGKPSSQQSRIHNRIRKLGFTVEVSDSLVKNACVLYAMNLS